MLLNDRLKVPDAKAQRVPSRPRARGDALRGVGACLRAAYAPPTAGRCDFDALLGQLEAVKRPGRDRTGG